MNNFEFLFTKTVATLGPASSTEKIIRQLINEGVRVFRINFSHGTFKEYETYLERIRSSEKHCGKYVAVMGDLSGPKIRVGKVIEQGVFLKPGQEVVFVKNDILAGEQGSEFTFSSTYPHFIDEVKVGEKILIDDGTLQLNCVSKSGMKNNKRMFCKVIRGGLVTSSKGINLPETILSVPSLTEKDYRCVEFAVKKGFDYLALSFVRRGVDVKALKEKLIQLKVRPEDNFMKRDRFGFSNLNNS
jgi:pyruvate kinase